MGGMANGHVYAPIKAMGDALKATVSWDSVKKAPVFNGAEITDFKLIAGVSFVQVAAIGQLVNGTVSWVAAQNKIYLYAKV